MIKRVLVGLGGTAYTSVAIRTAVELAQQHDALLTAVTVVDLNRLANVGPVPIGAGAAAEDLRHHRLKVSHQLVEQAVAEFETACQAAGLSEYRVLREEGDPFALLKSDARYHDVIVFGLRSVFEFGVLGEAHYEPTDVLAPLISAGVRPILAVSQQYRPIQRVMIAYSGSMESAKTMRLFMQLHPWPEITTRIVTFDREESEAKQLLADAAEYCRAHGHQVETQFIAADPREALLDEAHTWQADLIVMGNSARHVILRRILGETALHVMENADVPLFLCQ